MKIAYLTANDPNDRRSWSGTQFYMARALERHCEDVYCVGPLQLRDLKLRRALSKGLGLLGVNYLHTHTNSVSKRLGAMAAEKLAGAGCDVVFAPAGSVSVAHLETSAPIVYLSDATLAVMRGYYPEFTGVSDSSLRVADELERKAIRKSRQQIFSSTWAARSAIDDYGADPSGVHVIPFGANIENPPTREEVVAHSPGDRCKLLFVGVDWKRKGGEIAFEALVELERFGVPAELTVVGCEPPAILKHPRLRVYSRLNKNNPAEREQLDRLYREAAFFILPTRADCSPIALCEANAYALPVLSTETGGVPDIVSEGVNGFLFPLEARGGEYAARVRDTYGRKGWYEELRLKSRERFEKRLNWDAWASRCKAVFGAALGFPGAASDQLRSGGVRA